MAVESRGDLASRHGSIGRIAVAHSWSFRSDNPICTRTPFGRTPARNSCASSASGLEPHQDPDAGFENIQGLPLDAAYGVQADIEAKPDGFD